MKILRWMFLTIFIGILFLTLLMTNTTPGAISKIDNRKLASWGWRLSDIKGYVEDRIGFRDQMINLYTVLNDRLFHEMVHPIYEYGQNGYIFFKVKEEVYDGQWVDLFCRYLRSVQDYCESRDAGFVYCLNPAKTTTYREFLPRGYVYRHKFYDMMRDNLEKYRIHYVDNVGFLEEKSRKDQVFNRKYDAGHWNDLGAFHATNHMLEAIRETYPEVGLLTMDDFVQDTVVAESLPVSRFIVNEKVPDFVLKDMSVIDASGIYSGLLLNPSYPFFSFFQTGKDSLPRVMFFHGSYYNSRTKFYKNRFSSVAGIHNYQNFLNFDYYFNIFKPDYVILETAEYATSSGYFDPVLLRTKKLNPPYKEVREEKHRSQVLDSLQDHKIEKIGELVRISFVVPGQVSFGYLFCDGEEYDLEICGNLAKVSLLSKSWNESKAEIVLFDKGFECGEGSCREEKEASLKE